MVWTVSGLFYINLIHFNGITGFLNNIPKSVEINFKFILKYTLFKYIFKYIRSGIVRKNPRSSFLLISLTL